MPDTRCALIMTVPVAMIRAAANSALYATRRCRVRGAWMKALLVGALTSSPMPSHADEGGVSFWLPGQYGSLAALPGSPGWSFALGYYHTSVNAGGSRNFVLGGVITAGLKAHADLILFGPTYVFASPVLGGQLAISVLAFGGNSQGSITASLTGPRGNTISGKRTDDITSFGDLFPTISLKWNRGHHNFMSYLAGNIPVGAYKSTRLANLGLGHASIDIGGGYTYFDPEKGHELSAVLGFTYNFKNPDTNYRNGIDGHLDWAFSKFVSKTVHIGAVGYAYQQLTGDSGSGATLGSFKSRVFGVGPQLGVIVPIAGRQGYFNMRAYKEFGARNRAEGWNAWLLFSLALSPPKHAPQAGLADR